MILETLSVLNKCFVYKSDKKIDSWKIISSGEPVWRGDCDDYAVTAMWILSGEKRSTFWKNILTGKAELWYVKTAFGNPHMTLKWDGIWLCNIYPTPSPYCRFKKRFRAPAPLIALKLAIGLVLA